MLADSLRKEPVVEGLVSRSPVQWKLLLSLPAGSEEADFSDGDKRRFISFVIKEKFKRGMYPLPNSIPRGLKEKVIFVQYFSVCFSLGWPIYHFNYFSIAQYIYVTTIARVYNLQLYPSIDRSLYLSVYLSKDTRPGKSEPDMTDGTLQSCD